MSRDAFQCFLAGWMLVVVASIGGCGDTSIGEADLGEAGEVETAGEAEVPSDEGAEIPDRGEADDRGAAEFDDGAGDPGDEGPLEAGEDGGGEDGDGADGEADADATTCGNGVVEGDEECDNGARNSDSAPDACRTDCRRAHCGDGVTDTGEGCDDGNDVDTDACRNDCSLSTCGNGRMDSGEECDNGAANSDTEQNACRTNCVLPWCGDGVVDTETRRGAETCDDGNREDDDICPSTCERAYCGDGFVWTGVEECDGEATEPCATTCASEGARPCLPDCTWSEDCTPPEETCNGADDDCDTVPDDGFPCPSGAEVGCATECGSTGRGTCSASCELPAAGDCVPPAETCDGFDEDCDDLVDEDFPCIGGSVVECETPCRSTGSGICTPSCGIPPPDECTPPVESCDGFDDDCDTFPDDGFPCVRGIEVSCTSLCGTPGTGICTSTCQFPRGAACSAPAEACNAADEDCDGFTDEDFDCVRGATVPCITTCGSIGSGTCTSACEVPSGSACTPPAESCTAVDDDCDTETDEGYACVRGTTVSCTTRCGSAGTGTCTSSCAIPATGVCSPPAETCSGADDDCDTQTDEGFDCVRGGSRTCIDGACTGTQACGSDCRWGTCSIAVPANDMCAGTPVVDISSGGSFAGTTCGAANDYTTVSSCGSGSGSPDVVFRLLLTARRLVTLDTAGSAFDTVLHLRSGTCTGTQIACDDNGGGGTASRIRQSLAAGMYWVVVDGAGATNRGDFALNVSIVQIPGDTCDTAIDISAGGSFAGDTTLADDDSMPSCAGISWGGPDVFYRFTLAQQSVVYLDTVDGNTWNTVLGVFAPSTWPPPWTCPGTAVGCSNDACGGVRSQFHDVLPAGTYYVAVDGSAGTQLGPFTLFAQFAPVFTSCHFSGAITANGTYPAETRSMPGCFQPSCIFDHGSDTFFYIPACGTRSLALTDCVVMDPAHGDSVLYLRIGNLTAPDAACADDNYSCMYGMREALDATIPRGLSFVIVECDTCMDLALGVSGL